MTDNLEEIRGALARGYTSSNNSRKILDPDLIEDMTIEIQALIAERENELLDWFDWLLDSINTPLVEHPASRASQLRTRINQRRKAIKENHEPLPHL